MSDSAHLSLTVECDGISITKDFAQLFELLADEALVPEGHIVEVVLAPSERMIELKKLHFDLEIDTDVIAFPTDNPMLPPGFPALAGEIFLGVSQIQKNAIIAEWSFADEFFFVLTHGLLHLRGWDDSTDELRQKMFDEQHRILDVVKSKGFHFDNKVIV